MAVNTVGITTSTRQPVVYPNVSVYTSPAVGTFNATVDRQLSAGWWDVQTILNGAMQSATGGTTSFAKSQPTYLRFYSSSTLKPLFNISIANAVDYNATPFYLPEDSFFDLFTNGSYTGAGIDVTFYPVNSPFEFEGMGSLLDVTDTPPTSTAASFTYSMVKSNTGVGYDYDNDTLFFITPTSTTVPVGSYNIATAVRINRLTRGAKKYSTPVAITFNSTNSYWIAAGYSGSGFDTVEYGYTQFFIKNNELHIVSSVPIYDDGTTISGWVKVDCSTAGSKTFALGNTNASFNALKSSFTTFSSGTPMMSYHHDSVNKKVIYLGFRNTSGTSTRWSAYWSQWDIVNGTNDYTTSLGSRHEYFADNASGNYGFNLNSWVPDGGTLKAFAAKVNQAVPYNTYTGIMNQSGSLYTWQYPTNVYTSGNPDISSATSGVGTTSCFGQLSFINGDTVYFSNGSVIQGISNTIPASTSGTTLNSAYLSFVGNNIGANRYNRNLKSTIYYLNNTGTTFNWGWYVAANKIYVVAIGQAISTRNYSPKLYTGNIVMQTFSMPNTNANLFKLLSGFVGGIKNATSQYQVY